MPQLSSFIKGVATFLFAIFAMLFSAFFVFLGAAVIVVLILGVAVPCAFWVAADAIKSEEDDSLSDKIRAAIS